MGEHRAGISGPSGGSSARGIESPDGVGERPLHALMVSTHASNSGSRIFVFLLSLGSRSLALIGPLIFTLAHCRIVGRLGLLPLLEHFGTPCSGTGVMQPPASSSQEGRHN